MLPTELEDLGPGVEFSGEIYGLVGHSPFFTDFTREDIEQLASYMRIFLDRPGQIIIRDGDVG